MYIMMDLAKIVSPAYESGPATRRSSIMGFIIVLRTVAIGEELAVRNINAVAAFTCMHCQFRRC